MTPADALDMHRRMIAENGQTGFLRNVGANGAADVDSAPVRFRLMAFQPRDLVGGIAQGTRRAILMAEDVKLPNGGAFDLKKNSRLIWNGKTLTVTAVDDATRNVGGVLIAYELQVVGA